MSDRAIIIVMILVAAAYLAGLAEGYWRGLRK